MAGKSSFDDPEVRRRAVRALLIVSPFMFIGCYMLSAVQGARPRDCLLIAAVGTAMCLAAALVIHLLGAKSGLALTVVRVVLMLVRIR